MATKDTPKSVSGSFVFDKLGDQEPPATIVERVDADGSRTPIKAGRDGSITLDAAHLGRRSLVEVSGPPGSEPRRFHYDDLFEHFVGQPAYRLPKLVWEGWLPLFEVVSGHVEVCRPLWLFDTLIRPDAKLVHRAGLGATASLSAALARPSVAELLYPRFCRRVCDGTVDVYLRECCCPFVIPDPVIKDICELIDCDPVIDPPVPPDPDPTGPFPPGPGPDPLPPRPGPGPDPAPFAPAGSATAHTAAVVASIGRSLAGDDTLPGADQIIDLFGHHQALLQLDAAGRREYLKAYPYLSHLFCHCSLTKVASVPIQEDGTFDAVFFRRVPRAGCSLRVVYVVTQATPTGPKVIYDGRVGPITFGLDEDADLKVNWFARGCDRDDTIGDVGVFLNRIGATSSARLDRSVEQDGEDSYAPLATADGLVNAGANVWGGTLALRYSFHQDLKGLGAKYYRVRAQRVDDNGNAVGSPVEHVTPVAWGRFQGLQIVQTPIGPNPAGAPAGRNFYEIPYYADGWDFDANSFHAFVDTTALVNNARYVFVIDVFDATGKRLIPNNAPAVSGTEVKKAFSYLRKNPTANPAVDDLDPVPQKALANLFRVDNTPALAQIAGLQQRRNGVVVADVLSGCQFLSGHPGDVLRIRYRGHHPNGWLDHVTLTVTEGIGGPVTTALSNAVDTGVPPASALTPGNTFASLLGADPKCSFAANLEVRTRHTNGSSAVTNLWDYDTGAFALDQTAP